MAVEQATTSAESRRAQGRAPVAVPRTRATPARQSPPERTSAVVFKPARPRRAFDEIIGQIKAMIEDGTLQAGDRLPSERALAEQFAVSRNTVREALRMLEIAGLVQLKRGASGGSFISAPGSALTADTLSNALRVTDFSLANLVETLRDLSSITAATAIERMSDEDLAKLEDNVRRAAELTEAGEWDEKMRVHLEFYAIMAEATENPVLVLIVRTLLDVTGKLILRVGVTHDDSIVRSRRTLLKALRARNSDAAQAELARHFTKLHKMWLSGSYNGGRPGA
jgi:GntR family transcriptional regulator, transcriptional repressor for pyruvate dehydrogenase complex